MKKKVFAVILAALLSASVFSGCGSEPGGSGSESSGSTEKEHVGYTMPLKESATISIMCSENPNGESLPKTDVWKEFEKMTNVKIDWDLIEPVDYQQVASVRLSAGSDLADIVVLPGNDIDMKYQSSGLFVPLNDLIDTYGVNVPKRFEDNPAMKAQLTNDEGKIYFLCSRQMPSCVPRQLMFNMDWLEEIDAEVPTTTDEFYEVLKKFKENDLNHNGQKDEIPFTGVYTSLQVVIGGSFGLDLDNDFTVDDEGVVTCSLIDPNLKKYLAYMNKLYEEGLLDKEFPSKTAELLTSNAGADKVGCMADWSWFQMTYSMLEEGYEYSTSTDGKWMGAMPLKSETGHQQMFARSEIGGLTGITSSCENKELAYQVMDYIWSEEFQTIHNWGKEGVSWEEKDGERVFTEAKKNDPEIDRVSGRGEGPMLWQDEETNYAQLADWHINIDKELQNYVVPCFPSVYGTPDEADILAMYNSEITTYADQQMLLFITGEADVEKDFDAYVETLKGMGIDDVIKVKQAQYDRFEKFL